jgi:hypothetical protein
MKKSQLFQLMYDHIQGMSERALHTEKKACAYLGSNGSMCPVGAVLPHLKLSDQHLKVFQSFEGGIYRLIDFAGFQHIQLPKWFLNQIMMLQAVQQVHDRAYLWNKADINRQLLQIAKQFRIKPKTI